MSLRAVQPALIERIWYARSPQGAMTTMALQVSAPVPHDQFDWTCTAVLGDLEGGRQHDLFGIDSWQAVQLTMSFIVLRLGHFGESGWTFYWDAAGQERALPAELLPTPVAHR
ncbi:MAG TPA: hypothetical protein VIT92_02410 [Burkholderiaceae bacterium]